MSRKLGTYQEFVSGRQLSFYLRDFIGKTRQVLPLLLCCNKICQILLTCPAIHDAFYRKPHRLVGVRSHKFGSRCTECRQCKEKHGFPAGVQKVCRAPEKGKSHEKSYDSSWDFGALEGTRIPGPLIKRIRGASFVNFEICAESSHLIYHRHFVLVDSLHCLHTV